MKTVKIFVGICGGILVIAGILQSAGVVKSWFQKSSASNAPLTKEAMMGYLEQLSPLANQLNTVIQEMAPAFDNARDTVKKSENLSLLSQSKPKFKELTNQMEQIKTPDSLKPTHEQLVKAVGGYLEALQVMEKGVQEGNAQTIDQGATLLNNAAQDFNRVSQEIVSMKTNE